MATANQATTATAATALSAAVASATIIRTCSPRSGGKSTQISRP